MPVLFQYPAADIAEGFLFPLLCQHMQQLFKLLFRPRMDRRRIFAGFIIFERIPVGVRISVVSLAGGDPVHEHFDNIASRHRRRSHASLDILIAVINPVFVVAVSYTHLTLPTTPYV